jgi:antitoxin StbD
VSDLKRNPSAVIAAAGGQAVAILNHNRPAAYLVPAAAYEKIMDYLDDIELVQLAKERLGGPTLKVTIDELRAEISRDREKAVGQTGLDNTRPVAGGARKAVARAQGAKRKAA